MTDNQEVFQRVKSVKEAYQDELMRKAKVVGVGVGFREKGGERTNEIALVVMVSQKLPSDQLDPDDLIPTQIEGVPVDVQQVGEISAW